MIKLLNIEDSKQRRTLYSLIVVRSSFGHEISQACYSLSFFKTKGYVTKMNDLWDEIQEKLKNMLGPTPYSVWISHMQLILLTEDTIILGTQNKHVSRHVEENYKTIICNILNEHSQREYTLELREINDQEKIDPNPAVIEQSIPKRGRLINDKKTFDNFVVGACNQFVHAAAQAVADTPGEDQYNPLFIYGPTGLGKTHLLYAVANKLIKNTPKIDVLYITAEQFTNELINSLRHKKTQEFQHKYRVSCDVLLMDDIQFLSGKERTQENLFHIFEALRELKKQVVFTADVLPKEIKGLEPRLRTRCESGLIADTQPPDMETMIAILHSKAEEINLYLPNDVAAYLSMGLHGNVRELEGILNRLQALCRFHAQPPSITFVRQHFGRVLMQENRILQPTDIFDAVTTTFGITNMDLKSKRRTRNLVRPRHICMWLIRKHTSLSFPDIAALFGGRDHASVQYACNKINNGLKKDPDLKSTIALLERNLQL